MPLEDDRDQTINDVGERIFAALAQVAAAAQRSLSDAPSGISTGAPANPANPMVGVDRAEREISAINSANRENLRRLLREPFVARVEVDWGGASGQSVGTYYFARPSAAGLAGAIKDGQLVTSGAALG